jgi:hypothetical protein
LLLRLVDRVPLILASNSNCSHDLNRILPILKAAEDMPLQQLFLKIDSIVRYAKSNHSTAQSQEFPRS